MSNTPTEVHYYWRPGCPFCMSLRRELDKIGIVTVDHNIWDDPDAAATVRQHANDNETVPTVVINDVGMVNPSIGDVADYLVKHAPNLLPAAYEADNSTGLLRRIFER